MQLRIYKIELGIGMLKRGTYKICFHLNKHFPCKERILEYWQREET